MTTNLQEVTGVREQVSAEEWQLRVELAAAYRIAAHYGWDDLVFTHFSARVPGEEKHFLLNPFGPFFEELTASSLVKVDLSGQPVVETEYPVNPAGFVIHGAIHDARDDAHCILHTHTVAGMAVSAQEDGLLPITQTALSVYSDLAYHEYEGIVLDAEEKARLIPALGEKNNLILRNHGLLCTGKTVGEAFLRLFFLQKACEAQIAAQAGGGKLVVPPEDVFARVQAQTAGGMDFLAQFTSDGLVRKAERLDPGFRN